MHLARLEAHAAVGRLFERLPAIRLDSDNPSVARGLVFRKPQVLRVLW
jgi:cytochrome P450